MIRSATLFCSKAFNILLESLPPSKSVPLSKLSQYIPDDLLESVCVEHGSLKNFISSAPNLFQLNSVGIKNTLMVSRAMKVDALDKAYISNVVDEHDSKRPVEKKLFPDSPKELLLKISELLENTPQKLGVSALYGLLNSSERRTTRKCGGILTILRANTDLFTVSKLGMYVALRSKQISVLDDVNELECSDVEPEESMRVKDEEPKVRNIQPRLLNDTMTNEKVQHHAMFLVKFLPLHWTIEPNLLDTVPADVRAEHMSASPHRIIQRLMDFLEVKSSQGSKHRILRLKRGMYIPDVGLIRSDSEMRRLEVSHVFFNTYVTQFGGLRVDFDKLRGRISLPQHLEMLEKKEMLNLLRYRLYCDSCIHLPRFSAGPKSLPIKFQILKLTVPKYYTPIRALEHLLSSDYEKGLGGKSVVEWLKSNKDIFEVTIPYVKSKTVKSELCVRRRNISYCQISEDDTADECRNACPADNSSISFSTLLENLPERYVDAIPLENVEHYIISILKEKLHVTIDSSGIIWFKRRQKNESEI